MNRQSDITLPGAHLINILSLLVCKVINHHKSKSNTKKSKTNKKVKVIKSKKNDIDLCIIHSL